MNTATSATEQLDELARLLQQVEKSGLASLPPESLMRLGALYRQASSTLSALKRVGGNDALIGEVNQLVSRAYSVVYSRPRKDHHSTFSFLSHAIPDTVRKNIRLIGLSWGIFLLASVIGAFKYWLDPQSANTLIGEGWARIIQEIALRHAEARDWLPQEMRSVFGSYILVNNLRVALYAFATGALAGVGSLFILFQNGAMLGAVSLGVVQAGASLDFFAFIAGHGVPELSAIMFAGAAGLRLGWSVVDPGEYTRRESFRQAGYDALRLIILVALLLVWAAAVEAFISPTMLPYEFKFLFAAFQAVALVVYLALSGRSKPKDQEGP